jgi:hypothetical protein
MHSTSFVSPPRLQVFMDEMRDRGMVTKEEAASVFSNIPTLLDVHTGLLNVRAPSLLSCVGANGATLLGRLSYLHFSLSLSLCVCRSWSN